MKKVFFAIAFLAASSVAVLAQDSASVAPAQTQSSSAVQSDDQDKQAIATSELPASIQASLQGQDYSGWTVANAHKKEKDGKTMYSVELTKGSETKMVKFDADGNVVKEKDKE
ncbi:hypothetical protein [Chryseolinea sp. H1M3-3]|uniref:hypothetical protein n=1 Tax=Chryseolinea sp. H1M3-3 TaxID=3034144 RepID=UPI0023EB6A69|nr:hypothetical protein [Chryseolinea sp. H1M3-3]